MKSVASHIIGLKIVEEWRVAKDSNAQVTEMEQQEEGFLMRELGV
jgi:hypothetical protein